MPAATITPTATSGFRKRPCSSEDVPPLPQPKRARPSSSATKDTSLTDADPRACHESKSVQEALEDIPDCSLHVQDCVEVWINTNQPGYSSAMASSSKESENYRRRSKASRASHSSFYRAPTDATSAKAESETSGSIKTIHNPRVRNILVDNSINYEFSPTERALNREEILRRLELPRGSLSPSQGYALEDEYENFIAAHETAPNEDTLVATAFLPYFHRSIKPCGLNSSFTALAPLTAEQLPPQKPDVYFGEAYTSLHPEARKACERTIVPYARTPYLLVNRTVELKGVDGKADVARTQVMYNSAARARAMDSVRYFANPQSKTLNLRARTHRATFANSCLTIYATYSKPSESSQERDYVTQQIAGEMAIASA
ncbi:hypothetical protein BST61_g8739 [Cercospora zeina]